MGSYPGPLSRDLFLLHTSILSTSNLRPDVITPRPRSPRYRHLYELENGARIVETTRKHRRQRVIPESRGISGKKWGKVSKNTRMIEKRDYQRA